MGLSQNSIIFYSILLHFIQKGQVQLTRTRKFVYFEIYILHILQKTEKDIIKNATMISSCYESYIDNQIQVYCDRISTLVSKMSMTLTKIDKSKTNSIIDLLKITFFPIRSRHIQIDECKKSHISKLTLQNLLFIFPYFPLLCVN